jgi:hypothetical protein
MNSCKLALISFYL